jgi:hypothetical protein
MDRCAVTRLRIAISVRAMCGLHVDRREVMRELRREAAQPSG